MHNVIPSCHTKEQALLDGVKPFLDALFTGLAARGVDVGPLFLDHICYRVETVAEYDARKVQLARIGALLHEALIGGRPIATYKLHRPIPYEGREIPLVELPSPKTSSPYREGWEHGEFVLGETFGAFMARYPQVAWDTSAMAKEHNPEVRVELRKGLSAKFHPTSLEDVIKAEESRKSRR